MSNTKKTLWQIRSSILNELKGGFQVDDNRIDPEFIQDKVNDRRNYLVEQYIKENGPDESMYQHDCCLEIICEDVECNGRILKQRPIVNIKPLLTVAGKTYIRFVGPVDYSASFSYLPLHGIQFKDGDLWTSEDPKYTFLGPNKILLHNLPTDGMKYICFVGIFDNPNITCTDWKDKPYPIPGSLVSKLEYDVVQMLIKPMLLMNPEQPNNATDDVPGTNNNRK